MARWDRCRESGRVRRGALCVVIAGCPSLLCLGLQPGMNKEEDVATSEQSRQQMSPTWLDQILLRELLVKSCLSG